MQIKTNKNIVGFTSSIPIEIIFAANKFPLDLNNIFVSAKNPNKYIEIAESFGFPRNFCAWTKGLLGVILSNRLKIDTLVGVMEGDCSSNHSLYEYLDVWLQNQKKKDMKIIKFSYPLDKNAENLEKNIENFMKFFNVNWQDLIEIHKNLNRIRKKILKFEELFYFAANFGNLNKKYQEKFCFDIFDIEKLLKRLKNIDLHIWQVSCSDFIGDYKKFEKNFDDFWRKNNFDFFYDNFLIFRKKINDKNVVQSSKRVLKLGFLGVPTIIPEIYKFVDKKYSSSVKIIFNETQREFTFLKNIFSENDYKNEQTFIKKYIRQYLDYSYPYFIKYRISEIQQEIDNKNIDGFIHYTQSFCHKQSNDVLFRKNLKNKTKKIPILTLEEDRPFGLSERTKIRLEAFISVCKNKIL